MPSVRTLFWRFFPYLSAIKGVAVTNGILVLLAPLSSTALLWTFKTIIDEVLIAGRSGVFPALIGTYVLLALSKVVIDYAAQHLEASTVERIIFAIRSDLYAHALSLSPGSLKGLTTGDVLARLEGDTIRTETLIYSAPMMALADLAAVIVFFGFLFYLNWQLALCAAVALPLVVWVVDLYSPKVRKASQLSRKSEAHWMSLAEERLNALPVVQVFDAASHEQAAFCHRVDKVRRLEAASRIFQARQQAFVEVIVAVAGLLVLGLGTHLIQTGRLSIGELVTFIGTVGSLYAPVRSLAKAAGRVQHATSGAQRVASFFDTEGRVRERADARSLHQVRGRLEISDVCFAYPETGRTVLNGITCTIEPGELVAIVGPSGSGKSSLMRLLLRQYDVDSGAIRLDGVDVRALKLSSLRAALAPVFQEPYILSGTIESNVRYGAPAASENELANAAMRAAISSFAGPRGGLKASVGSRGSRLSGGQRQRLALGRALLKDAPVLILDEATAGVDSETEVTIQKALAALGRSKTVIVVAHRLSSIIGVDRVLVLEGGRIVEEGRPRDLLARSSRCRDLFEAQLVGQEAAE